MDPDKTEKAEQTSSVSESTVDLLESSVIEFVMNNFYFRIGAMLILGFLAIFILALAFWVFKDVRSRTRSKTAWVVAVASVLLLNIVGLIFYMLLRPGRTLREKAVDKLELDLLEDEADDQDGDGKKDDDDLACPNCSKDISRSYSYCPYCEHEINPVCWNCQGTMQKEWSACPHCGQAKKEDKDSKNIKKV